MVITVEKMSRSEVQKIKLLVLYDFLRRETDENNLLSTAEIIEGLKPDGMPVKNNTNPAKTPIFPRFMPNSP